MKIEVPKECNYCEHLVNGKKSDEYCGKCIRNTDLFGDFFRLDQHVSAYVESMQIRVDKMNEVEPHDRLPGKN